MTDATAIDSDARQPAPAEALARYAPLVADWDNFVAAMRRTAPPCVVANRNRIGADSLEDILRADGRAAVPVPWSAGAFRCPPEARPGLWWPSQAGLFNVQEEASLLPMALLDPKPGERALDLCAAPGGKTAQICMALGGRGTVVANDRDGRRLAGVRDKMKRLGLLNLTTTVFDGGDFPLSAGPFDRVLVDAPCSAEGTNFAAGAAYARSSRNFRHWIAGQQRAVLRRAVALTRPGGRVVYSTCSLAPEENEAVVDAVLREAGTAVRAVPPVLSGLAHDGGLESWQGQCFHPDVRHGVRLWPHRSGTSGFFAIALERVAGGGPYESGDAVAQPADCAEAGQLKAAIRERYGLPDSAFDGLVLIRKGRHVQAVAADHRPPAWPRPVAIGVPFVRADARIAKPTTAAALLIGAQATRNVVEVDAAQRDAYQARRPFTPTPAQLADCDDGGHAILRYLEYPLGIGLLRRGAAPVIESQFPRVWVPHAHRGGGDYF